MDPKASSLASITLHSFTANSPIYARYHAWQQCTENSVKFHDYYGDNWLIPVSAAILDQMEATKREGKITPGANLLAVFAHPDDETFRAGGTLALLARGGLNIQVMTATRGGAGSCGKPPICSPADLPAIRSVELQCACDALGVQPPILLDYLDGQLEKTDPETLTDEILAVIHKFKPHVMLSFGPDGLSGHPDHIAIGLAAAEAFRRAKEVSALYTVAVPRSLVERLGMQQIHAVPDEAISLAVDVAKVWNAKMSAIFCHRTQLGESPILDDPEARQRIFLGVEHFCLADSRPAPDGKISTLKSWLENETE